MESHDKRRQAQSAPAINAPLRTEPGFAPLPVATPTSTVVSIGDWKKHKSDTRPLSAELTSIARSGGTPARSQMQAALLRLILSDEISDNDLDVILQTALSTLALNKG